MSIPVLTMRGFPDCVCGKSRGWTIMQYGSRHGYACQDLRCGYCKRTALLTNKVGATCVWVEADVGNGIDTDYVFGVYDSLLTSWVERVEQARKPYVEKHRQVVNAAFALPLEAQAADVPERYQRDWLTALTILNGAPACLRPQGFEALPQPPHLSRRMECFLETIDGDWHRVLHHETYRVLEVEHPARMRHRDRLSAVATAIACSFKDLLQSDRFEPTGAADDPYDLAPAIVMRGCNGHDFTLTIRARRGDPTHVMTLATKRPIVADELEAIAAARSAPLVRIEGAFCPDGKVTLDQVLAEQLVEYGHTLLRAAQARQRPPYWERSAIDARWVWRCFCATQCLRQFDVLCCDVCSTLRPPWHQRVAMETAAHPKPELETEKS